MIPCVVLASTIRKSSKRADIRAFEKEYANFRVMVRREGTHEISFRSPDDQAGGNDGGPGDAGPPPDAVTGNRKKTPKPRLGQLRRCFWHFWQLPGKGNCSDEKKYPHLLRFELCLYFEDIQKAFDWLASNDAGRRLGTLFEFVEVVGVSTPKAEI